MPFPLLRSKSKKDEVPQLPDPLSSKVSELIPNPGACELPRYCVCCKEIYPAHPHNFPTGNTEYIQDDVQSFPFRKGREGLHCGKHSSHGSFSSYRGEILGKDCKSWKCGHCVLFCAGSFSDPDLIAGKPSCNLDYERGDSKWEGCQARHWFNGQSDISDLNPKNPGHSTYFLPFWLSEDPEADKDWIEFKNIRAGNDLGSMPQTPHLRRARECSCCGRPENEWTTPNCLGIKSWNCGYFSDLSDPNSADPVVKKCRVAGGRCALERCGACVVECAGVNFCKDFQDRQYDEGGNRCVVLALLRVKKNQVSLEEKYDQIYRDDHARRIKERKERRTMPPHGGSPTGYGYYYAPSRSPGDQMNATVSGYSPQGSIPHPDPSRRRYDHYPPHGPGQY